MIRVDPEEAPTRLVETNLEENELAEDHLREWLIHDSRPILGEKIRIIGREVRVKDIGDAIDVLGIDRDGNVVVVELKRGDLRGNVDFQALKYAAYCSYWDYDRLKAQFEKFKSSQWGDRIYDEETSFTEALDAFCNDDYVLNQDQRLILVGESMRDRLEIVVRWLSDRGVDITAVTCQLLSDDGRLYLDAEQAIPVPERGITDVRPDTSEEPWKDDGRGWHVNERTNEATGDLLLDIVAAFEDIEFLDGPDWGQKLYLSFKRDRKRRIAVRTKRTLLHVDLYDIPNKIVDIPALAEDLGIPDDDVTFDDDFRATGRSGLRITCRPGTGVNIDSLTAKVEDILTATAEQ